MKNYLVAAKVSDPAERIKLMQHVVKLLNSIPSARLRINGPALESAFGNPPTALPIEADATGIAALQSVMGDSVTIDPDETLAF